MKQFLKILKKSFEYFILFLVIYINIALLIPLITVNKNPISSNDISIYIQNNGVHSDIIVPAKNQYKDWTTTIKRIHTKQTDSTYNYIAMGWGDKGFYLETPTWAELKPSIAFKAAFGLGNTAMHTDYIKDIQVSKSCKKITISQKEYQLLIQFLANSFQKKDTQFLILNTTANYGLHDAFYEANGSYSLFSTCNTWTNNALKACHQKACLWTPHQQGIFRKYTKN